MSIKIEIHSETVAEMQSELRALLFGETGPGLKIAGPVEVPAKEKSEAGKMVALEDEPVVAEQPEEKVEKTTRTKRRTKAEIEADKAAKQAEQEKAEAAKEAEPEQGTEAEPESKQEATEDKQEAATEDKQEEVTIHQLRQLCASKGAAKKPKIAALLKKFGGSKLPEIDEAKYADLYTEIEAI